MPIPDLTADGWLPEGVHDCTLEELLERFGRFQETDRRQGLARKLREYVTAVREAGIGVALYVDGSFVTSKPDPGDIDVVLILSGDLDLSGIVEVPPFQYNPRNGRYVKRIFGIEAKFGFDGDEESGAAIDHFQKVRGHPGRRKGIARIRL